MSSELSTPKTKPRIRPLPERLINKIAAGEVVERPASVVKELVENALDAGAARIEIAIERSGTRLIKIVDNGCGIDEDQIEIAFSRHATSKLSELKDLDYITSYGFRGEALPSIASVSRLRMVSRTADSPAGTEVIFEGGVLQSKKPAAAPVGTTVEVENLFFNTPARRKFLKAETTEARHISRVAVALAIANPLIGFSYSLNERSVFSLPAGLDLAQRVPALLAPGRKFVAVSGSMGAVAVSGYVAPPELAQNSRNSQYIFVNGRLVQSAVLAHALVAGYGELLPKGLYPAGALLVTVDPAEVDVNVHPAKTEIRLARERDVHDAVYRIVKEALRGDAVIPSLPVRAAPTDVSHGSSAPPRDWGGRQSNLIPGMGAPPADSSALKALYQPPPAPYEVSSAVEPRVDPGTGEILSEPAPSSPPADGADAAAPELLGRLGGLYLLFQSGDDLLVVDQHAAHERVLFEQTMRQMDKEGATSQQLLMPVNVELGPEQMTLFEEARSLLAQSGFLAAEFGERTVRVEGIPAVFGGRSPEKAFRAILDDVASLTRSGYDLKKAIAQSLACRAAVMAGDRLSDREASALVEALFKCENRFACPHGRPTIVRINRRQLDRQFGRA